MKYHIMRHFIRYTLFVKLMYQTKRKNPLVYKGSISSVQRPELVSLKSTQNVLKYGV